MSCENCGKSLLNKRKNAKFCCGMCRQEAFRKRHDIVKPAFLASKPKTDGYISKIQFKGVKSPRIGIVTQANVEALNILQAKRNFCINRIEEMNQGKKTFTTIGGALIGAMIFQPTDKLLGAVIGGAIGYGIGKDLENNTEDQRKRETAKLMHQVKLIDKQINILKKSEFKKLPSPGISQISKSESKIINTHELQNRKTEYYEFNEIYKSFFGAPSKPFSTIIYGLPKSGKSNFSIQLASYLSRNFGKTLYISSEEGLSNSFIDKVGYQLAENKNFDVTSTRKLSEMKTAVKDYEFVFIDSISISDISHNELEEIKKENPKTSFFSIIQSTKAGNFKGNNEFAHNCDVIIKVDSGVAMQQGRFNPASELNIFPSIQ